MVRARELTSTALLKAIQAGDFYASSGVHFKELDYDSKSQTISIEIDAQEGVEYETQFIGTLKVYDKKSVPRTDKEGKPINTTRKYSADGGKVLATKKGNSIQYKLTGNELYVRAVVTSNAKHPDPSFKDQKQQAWTQPFGWRK